MRKFSTESALDFLDGINEQVEDFVRESTTVAQPIEAGLDMRCGRLYMTDEAIVVSKYNDRSIQYYGGFEYVDSEHRIEVGDYVFYTADDARVSEHLEQYEANKETVDE